MLGDENNFPYPPLPEAVGGIRVLTINPGDFSDPLVCTLRSVAFSEKPRYVALSYTWNDAYRDNSALPTSKAMVTVPPKLRSSVTWNGLSQSGQASSALQGRSSRAPELNKNKPDPITLNGSSFFISHNLHLCMLHLRSLTHSLTLWVDAVCINQKNTDEINKQIAIMSFIYSRAQKVVAWLGMKAYGTQQNPFHCMSMDWKAGEASQLAATLAGDEKMRYTSTMDKHTLSRLADSDYWKRLWIVQEACLAYELVFVYGSHAWSFDRMSMLDPLENIPSHDTDERMRYDAMLRLIEARRARHTDATRLESLIERFMKQSCSDLRDRVYGLVGLANDVHPFSGAGHQKSLIGTKTIIENTRRLLYEAIEDPSDPHGTRSRKGRIKIDRLRSFYDLWKDVVTHAFFCARPIQQPWTSSLVSTTTRTTVLILQEKERSIKIVRISGIVQEALGQHIESGRVSCSEFKKDPVPSRPDSIRAIGYVAGKITQIGPDYASLVRSPEAIHDWVECWDEIYHLDHDLQQLRAMNEEFLFRIFRYTEEDLARIQPIKNHSAVGWLVSGIPSGHYLSDPQYIASYGDMWNHQADDAASDPGPRICIGTNHLIALVPPEASVGDLMIRFWNCSAAIVMRPYIDRLKQCSLLMMVGRADVARTIEQPFSKNHDEYAEQSLFYNAPHRSTLRSEWPNSGAVYVDLDFPTLQIITAFIDAQGQEPGRDGYT